MPHQFGGDESLLIRPHVEPMAVVERQIVAVVTATTFVHPGLVSRKNRTKRRGRLLETRNSLVQRMQCNGCPWPRLSLDARRIAGFVRAHQRSRRQHHAV